MSEEPSGSDVEAVSVPRDLIVLSMITVQAVPEHSEGEVEANVSKRVSTSKSDIDADFVAGD